LDEGCVKCFCVRCPPWANCVEKVLAAVRVNFLRAADALNGAIAKFW
jgi:hypothetical protein